MIGVIPDFLAAHQGRFAAGTIRHYDRALVRFAHFVQARHPRQLVTLDRLSRDVLEAWFGELRTTLAVSTARLYVGAVITCWEWAWDSEVYGDVTPRPRRIAMPTPSFAKAQAPTWAQMDDVIHACTMLGETARTARDADAWEWRRRLLWLLRCTGLRVWQAMRLRWDDIDLAGGEMQIRGELGKSNAERTGRVVPLAPVLIAEMATWGVRQGWLVAPNRQQRVSPTPAVALAWQTAGVPRRIWGPAPGRKKGNPHHGFRKGFKTGLARLGIDGDVRDYLVGHSRGVDRHYIDAMVGAREAVALVPPLTTTGTVQQLRRAVTGRARGVSHGHSSPAPIEDKPYE